MSSPITAVLTPHGKDLGGFRVQRLLPAPAAQMVGPFIFFDHFGPVTFAPGAGIGVRPHPHIGLATVTYLFGGRQIHRDSLGSVQIIHPGDVNWMTAGKGIVHSERSVPEDRIGGHSIHGLQTWVALPKSHERSEPAFSHHPTDSLPVLSFPGVEMRLLAGTAFGQRAPTPTFSPMFYIDVEMQEGAVLDLPPEHEERGVYVVEGSVQVGGDAVPPQHMALLRPWTGVHLEARTSARLMLLGGTKMDGPRLIWWNFVASSKELIDAASARWSEQRFPQVPGETDFIPLP